jgi:hypothetical protein
LQLALTALGGDLAEVGARPVTTSAASVRMIGPVEGFHAEGQFMSLLAFVVGGGDTLESAIIPDHDFGARDDAARLIFDEA